jgi:hypothetical protein
MSTALNTARAWPPEHRCETCGWWQRMKAGWFLRSLSWLFRVKPHQGHGWCKHPQRGMVLPEATWQSYVCHRHTTSDRKGLQISLNVLATQQLRLMDTLREKQKEGKV